MNQIQYFLRFGLHTRDILSKYLITQLKRMSSISLKSTPQRIWMHLLSGRVPLRLPGARTWSCVRDGTQPLSVSLALTTLTRRNHFINNKGLLISDEVGGKKHLVHLYTLWCSGLLSPQDRTGVWYCFDMQMNRVLCPDTIHSAGVATVTSQGLSAPVENPLLSH